MWLFACNGNKDLCDSVKKGLFGQLYGSVKIENQPLCLHQPLVKWEPEALACNFRLAAMVKWQAARAHLQSSGSDSSRCLRTLRTVLLGTVMGR